MLFPRRMPIKSGFYEALLEVEQRRKNAPNDPEGVVLARRLEHALNVEPGCVPLIAMRVLTKCIRDGSVSRDDLIALRDNPLPEPEAPPGSTTILP